MFESGSSTHMLHAEYQFVHCRQKMSGDFYQSVPIKTLTENGESKDGEYSKYNDHYVTMSMDKILTPHKFMLLICD